MTLAGCESLDGRNRNRKGNNLFRQTKFVAAVAQYEKALTTVEDPTIHYNLGLAYSKVNKPGSDKAILLDVAGSFACGVIPQTKPVSKKTCVREGEDDKRFLDCNEDKDCPTDKHRCKETSFCTLDSPQLATLSSTHFKKWLAAHPDDTDTAKLMTQVWTDSGNYAEAIEFWEAKLKDKPNDPDIMGILAGINLKSDNWRESIGWYRKVADATKDTAGKLAAYTYIGRVSRAKLVKKDLSPMDSIELADLGIGALQKAQTLDPKNPATFGLMHAIYSLRGTIHGASFAGGIDRASAQDLLKHQSVLIQEAKKAQEAGQPAGTTPPTNGTSSTPSPKTGG